MIISTNVILQKIEEEFANSYKPFSKFKDSGELWDKCINFVKNEDLMNKMIFCNDFLQIPPIKVFICVESSINTLTDYEKKAIGAFWGFVFKFIFNYKNQRSTGVNINCIKTGTYFYDIEEPIIVGTEEESVE